MRIRKHAQSNPATRGKRRESSASMPSITRAEPSLAGIPTLRVVLSRSAIERGELMAVPELGQEVFPGIPRGFADSANSADGCDVNRNSLALRAEADRVAGLSASGVSTPAKQHSPPAKASRLRPEDDLTGFGESGDSGPPSGITPSALARSVRSSGPNPARALTPATTNASHPAAPQPHGCRCVRRCRRRIDSRTS